MDMAHIQRIEELRRLSVPALKREYKEVFGQETRSSHKQYLFRRIAWQLQVQLEGGLSERAVDRAIQIADDADLRSVGPKGFWSWPEQAQKIQSIPHSGAHRDGRLPKPGTMLTRRHKGRDVVVQVLEEGFLLVVGDHDDVAGKAVFEGVHAGFLFRGFEFWTRGMFGIFAIRVSLSF